MLDGVSVEVVDGSNVIQAPLFFISAGQINAQLPFEIASSSVQVRVRNAQGVSNSEPVAVTPRSPSLFTKTMDGKGEAIVLHADYTPVSTTAPAKPSEVLILYLTGLGAVSPAAPSGRAGGDGSPAAPLNLVTDDVAVLINGEPAVVDFKGLAPYFVGLYQINFHVPSVVVPGNAEISVQAGANASRDGVTFAVTIPMDSPVTASLPAAGGTVMAGAVTIDAPGGAVAQNTPLTVYKSGSDYVIAGLSAGTSAPITITVDLPANADTSADIYLALRQIDGPEEYVKATLNGTKLSATFPPVPAVAKSQLAPQVARAPRLVRPLDATGPDLATGLILAIILGDTSWTPNGNFDYIYNPATVAQDHLTSLANGFDLAFYDFSRFYKSWSPALPIQVRIEPLLHHGARYCRGEVVQSFTSGFFVRIHPAVLRADWVMKDSADTPEDVAKHLLVHYVAESVAGPKESVLRTQATSDLWLNEAAAVGYLWKYTGATPAVSEVNYDFAPVGLGAFSADASWQAVDYRKHGFGAAKFFRAVWDNVPMYAALEQVWTNGKNWWEAMPAAGVDLGANWASFCKNYNENVFAPPDVWVKASSAGTWPGTELGNLASPPAGDISVKADLPSLSARLFRLRLPATLPAGYDLLVSVQNAIGVAAQVYTLKDTWTGDTFGDFTFQGEGTSVRVKNLATVMGSLRQVAIILYNNQADPTKPNQDATVVVGFRPATLALLHQDNYVKFSISGTFNCDTSLLTCPSTSTQAGAVSAFNLFVVDPNAQPVAFTPPGWGTSFSVANDQYSQGLGQTYKMDVTFSDAGDEIVDAKVSYTTVEPLGKSSEQIDTVFEIQHVKLASATNKQQVFQVTGAAAAVALTSLSWKDTVDTIDGKASGVSFGPNDGITLTFKNCSNASTCQ